MLKNAHDVKKANLCFLYIGLAVAAAALVWASACRLKEREQLDRRMKNVEALLRIVREKPELATVDQVIAEARKRGIQLFNPCPQRPMESFYRMYVGEEGRPDTVVIEEQEIDHGWVVQGLNDGSVVVRRSPSTRWTGAEPFGDGTEQVRQEDKKGKAQGEAVEERRVRSGGG